MPLRDIRHVLVADPQEVRINRAEYEACAFMNVWSRFVIPAVG